MTRLWHLVLVVVVGAFSAWADPQVGVAAPRLSLERVLQAPSGQATTWAALRGQAVVIEFWATWCTGCREQIGHLNALEKQFQGRAVRFLAITDEDPGLVSRFLKGSPISGWVGIDQGGQTVRDYGIVGWPTTVLVDGAGIVRGVGNASALTGALLEDLVAGRPVAFARSAGSVAKLQSLPEPLFQMMVRPAAPESATGYGPGALSGLAGKRWEAWGVTLGRLLSDAYAVPEERIGSGAGVQWDRQARYDVALGAPALTDARRKEMLRQVLEATFQLKATAGPREMEVLVLQAGDGGASRLRPSPSTLSSFWGEPGHLTSTAVSLARLVSWISTNMGKPVLDETGLTGRYDFELRWDVRDPKALGEALMGQLGLRLTTSRRPMAHLRIDGLTMPATW